MGYDYGATHEKILQSAKKFFLKKGYQGTNLREICRGADVTNGAFYRHFDSKEDLFKALVAPCVDGLMEMYDASNEACHKDITKDSILECIEIDNDSIITLINYIYDNFDSFKLLLLCSGGTSYSNIVEDLVDLEVRRTLGFFHELKELGVELEIPRERSIHILSHYYLESIFQCVLHNYRLEDTLEEVTTLVDFFNAGWRKILGVQ
jgi:AcrR family transcriptional regulator